MHFTFVGTVNKQASGISPCLQKADDFLSQKFLTIENDSLQQFDIIGTVEANSPDSLVNAFQNSSSYRELWSPKKK